MQEKTFYYTSYDEDIIQAQNQDFSLPPDYQWQRDTQSAKVKSWLVRYGIRAFSYVFCPFYLHLHRHETYKEVTGLLDRGCYLYVNHTQTVGDAAIPYYVLKKKWPAIIVSPANLSIPVIGKLIPYGGGLPIPSQLHKLRDFNQVVHQRISNNRCVVIYPEAHVWPYYTGIRPFELASFHYPAKDNAPVYCLTNTYQKRRWGKKPQITSFLDGPFFAPEGLKQKERQQVLSEQVHNCMQKRSQYSTYKYIKYQRKDQQ